MIKVYHLSDRAPDTVRWDAMVGNPVEEAWDAGYYDHVADVDTDDLEVAWERTNTIDRPWYEVSAGFIPPEPHPPTRSSCVGDVFTNEDGTDCVRAAMFGFAPLRAVNVFAPKEAPKGAQSRDT